MTHTFNRCIRFLDMTLRAVSTSVPTARNRFGNNRLWGPAVDVPRVQRPNSATAPRPPRPAPPHCLISLLVADY